MKQGVEEQPMKGAFKKLYYFGGECSDIGSILHLADYIFFKTQCF